MALVLLSECFRCISFISLDSFRVSEITWHYLLETFKVPDSMDTKQTHSRCLQGDHSLAGKIDSVRPHRRQPTRLPRPWDSPGENTGVGCHFLLQCRKVKSESEVAQSCPTLSNPMDWSLPGSSIHGMFQPWVLEWGAIALSETTHSGIKKRGAIPRFPGLSPLLSLKPNCSSYIFPE